MDCRNSDDVVVRSEMSLATVRLVVEIDRPRMAADAACAANEESMVLVVELMVTRKMSIATRKWFLVSCGAAVCCSQDELTSRVMRTIKQ